MYENNIELYDIHLYTKTSDRRPTIRNGNMIIIANAFVRSAMGCG